MPKHNYTSREALDTIMESIRAKVPSLSAEIQQTIDFGKEVPATSAPSQQRGDEPNYRRKVSLAPEEALQTILDALQAHFVEQPMFINSVVQNLAMAAESAPTPWIELTRDPENIVQHGPDTLRLVRKGDLKVLAIEVQPETRLVKTGEEVTLLTPVPEDQVIARREALNALQELVKFEDWYHGDPPRSTSCN